MKKNNLRALTVTAVLGAVGFVLMFLDFSIPIMPGFIKFDFSELPALIAAFAYGPVYGVAVCLLKNLLHLFVTSTACVGEMANFLMGLFLPLVAGLIYQHRKNRKSALLGSLAGSVAMGVACVAVNYWIVYPIYYKVFENVFSEEKILAAYQAILPKVDSIFEALLIFNLPFTFIKAVIVSLICFLIYKKLTPILKR